MSSNNLSLALKEKKEAEAALKTSFFGNRKVDSDSAAHHFEKAGQLFKLGKSYKESKACYLEAAKHYNSCRSLFSVAKCYQAAAVVCNDLGEPQDSLKYIQLAGNSYIENGTLPSAVLCYTKGAETLADLLPRDAANLYLTSADLERDNEHTRDAVKHFLAAKRIFANNAMYKECIQTVNTVRDIYVELENLPQIRKCNLSLVVLHLALGDTVAAKNSIQGDVSVVADDIVQAVEAGDDQELKKLSAHNDIVYLDTEIARIAKFLTIEGAVMPDKKLPTKSFLTTKETFKSSSVHRIFSNKSMREELLSSNKKNREELFGSSSKRAIHKTESPVTTGNSVENNEPNNTNPFGGDENTNSFGDDNDVDLC